MNGSESTAGIGGPSSLGRPLQDILKVHCFGCGALNEYASGEAILNRIHRE